MPTYEFECPKCGVGVEIKCKYEDLKVPVCDECGTLTVRTYTPPNIQFKGKGFYCNDK